VSFPTQRPRRLRQTGAVRALVAQTRLHPADLVLPVFVREGAVEAQPITSMPGVVQHSLDSLVAVAHQAVEAGLGGLMLAPARRIEVNDSIITRSRSIQP